MTLLWLAVMPGLSSSAGQELQRPRLCQGAAAHPFSQGKSMSFLSETSSLCLGEEVSINPTQPEPAPWIQTLSHRAAATAASPSSPRCSWRRCHLWRRPHRAKEAPRTLPPPAYVCRSLGKLQFRLTCRVAGTAHLALRATKK